MNNEIQEVYGCLDTIDHRDYVLKAPLTIFPKEYELKMPKVKNQWSISSCAAFALSLVLEYYAKKEHNIDIELSTDYIYGNRENSTHKGKGMVMRDALKNAKTYGDATYMDYPYNTEVPGVIQKFINRDQSIDNLAKSYAINTYFSIKDNDSIKYNIYRNGPCICSVTMHKYKLKDKVMIFDYDKPSQDAHAMVIYGWCEKGWLVQNSLGELWGSGGKCILPFDTEFNSVWGIIDENSPLQNMIVKPNLPKKIWYKISGFLGIIGETFKKAFKIILDYIF